MTPHPREAAEAVALLPCPFCGSRGEIRMVTPMRGYSYLWFIRCTDAYCRGAVIESSNREKAIAAWNRRTQPAMSALLDELRGLVTDVEVMSCGLAFALCNMDHAGTRRDVKNSQVEAEALKQRLAAILAKHPS